MRRELGSTQLVTGRYDIYCSLTKVADTLDPASPHCGAKVPRVCSGKLKMCILMKAWRQASDVVKVLSFQGHSLGGSLGTMLMLMYVRRGVIPASALNPTYTFGAPAIFCEGASGCGPCSAPVCTHQTSPLSVCVCVCVCVCVLLDFLPQLIVHIWQSTAHNKMLTLGEPGQPE
jgi:hypothetical protein